ncbi:MAG: NADH-quinone oxidoreductase subunit H [Candidatus Dormibacteraeota bacterium]|nr:NADH-quinone oxidoreductase subunit H [Candidatus Dormibacteraeota bacterium]
MAGPSIGPPGPRGDLMLAAAIGQVIAVLTVLALSPLLKGWIENLKAKVQSRRGPSPLQPYHDLRKLLGKERMATPYASWVFRMAPYVVFAVPLAFAMLIPVLTAMPLSWALMADMVGSGFVIGIGGFFANLAAMDSGSPYGGLGASRSRFVSSLAEPTFIVVFFAVGFISGGTVPFVVNDTLFTSASHVVPSHALVAAAFLLVVLAEAGRLPIDNPNSSQELSMIESSRLLEFSGPDQALMEWGGYMKLFVLLIVWLNVLVLPLGLATAITPLAFLWALVTLALKMMGAALLLVGIESALAKIRILRVPEYLGGSFVLAFLGLVLYTVGH